VSEEPPANQHIFASDVQGEPSDCQCLMKTCWHAVTMRATSLNIGHQSTNCAPT